MSNPFSRYLGSPPVEMPASQAITPATVPAPAPRAVPGADAQVLQPFVNAQQNSRLGVPAGNGKTWALKWRASISDNVQATTLLAAGERILAYGEMSWQLFDGRGNAIQERTIGESGATLDPQQSLFYAADQFGRLAAFNLNDGKPAFTMLLRQTKAFRRTFIDRRGALLITVGFQLAVDAHKEDPQYSIAEVTDLHDPGNRKSWIDPGGPVIAHDLVAHTNLMLPAMIGSSLVLALRDGVYVLDSALEIRHALTGSFVPAALSLDEAGIHLVVQAGQTVSLWLLKPDGERVYSFDLPPGITRLLGPPIVGYNHVVYLISGRHILAVGQDGKLDWSREATSPIAGAAVTADDQLLTSEGSQVAAWDAKGERRVLFTFPEALTTAPILTKSGELLAAGRSGLFCAER